jgi:hypothetical protein
LRLKKDLRRFPSTSRHPHSQCGRNWLEGAMNWNAAMEEDRQALGRIVALLFAMAGLADRLGGAPRPVRCLVLAILRYAETIARDFVIDTALEQGAQLAPDLLMIPALHDGDDAADAKQLATAFRALAALPDGLADCDPRRFGTRIASLCLGLAACGAEGCLSAGGFGWRLRVSPSRLTIGHRDSS